MEYSMEIIDAVYFIVGAILAIINIKNSPDGNLRVIGITVDSSIIFSFGYGILCIVLFAILWLPVCICVFFVEHNKKSNKLICKSSDNIWGVKSLENFKCANIGLIFSFLYNHKSSIEDLETLFNRNLARFFCYKKLIFVR